MSVMVVVTLRNETDTLAYFGECDLQEGRR